MGEWGWPILLEFFFPIFFPLLLGAYFKAQWSIKLFSIACIRWDAFIRLQRKYIFPLSVFEDNLEKKSWVIYAVIFHFKSQSNIKAEYAWLLTIQVQRLSQSPTFDWVTLDKSVNQYSIPHKLMLQMERRAKIYITSCFQFKQQKFHKRILLGNLKSN